MNNIDNLVLDLLDEQPVKKLNSKKAGRVVDNMGYVEPIFMNKLISKGYRQSKVAIIAGLASTSTVSRDIAENVTRKGFDAACELYYRDKYEHASNKVYVVHAKHVESIDRVVSVLQSKGYDVEVIGRA